MLIDGYAQRRYAHMKSSKKQNLFFALLISLICALPSICLAQKPSGGPTGIGLVDWEAFLDQFEDYKRSARDYQVYVQEREERLRSLSAAVVLSDEERTEYDQLVSAAVRSAQQKERLKQLQDLSAQREKELQQLGALDNATEEQKKRADELRALSSKRQQEIQSLRDRLRDEVAKKDQELMKPLEDRIKKALASLASEKNLIAVVKKEVVLHGGVDITKELADRVNKK
jgi:Skp family chaperone for outer membrane proteins